MTRSFASRSSRITLAVLAASCGLASLNRPALSQQTDIPTILLPGHISRIVDESQPLGALEASAPVRLAITLPLRNQAQLNSLLTRLYDPLDPLYGHFLTSMDFAAHFAPTAADYAAARRFVEAAGLKVTATHSNNLVLDAQGTSAQVEAAFSVKLMKYRSPQGLLFHAPDQEPSIPPSLIGKVQAIVGLDSAGVAHPYLIKRPASGFAAPHAGSGPGGGYAPADIKTAYNLNSVAEKGTGQTLGLFELDGYSSGDITAYENQFGIAPAVPLQNVLIDGFNGSAGNGAGEVTLDIELMTALAPKATKIVVYEGPNSTAGLIDTYNKIASDNTAKEISTSWGLAEANNAASTRSSENTIFQQMAAQGQSIFAAAGDSGAYDNGSSLSVDDPASQPYMVGVGGTRLTTGTGAAYSSESVWNGGSVSAGAGGGGISVEWGIPSYQSGVISGASLGSTTARNVPDVSLNADPNTGYAIYYGGWQTYGGTSCAAPLWAAFTSLVNQRRVAGGSALLGFPNPAIYTIGKGSRYSSDFHDIADNSTNLKYPAVAGYDDATGWGTFNGANLLADLAGSGGTGGTAPSAPTNLTATAGNAQVSLSWTASTGAASYNVYRSTSSGTETSYKTGLTSTTLSDTGLTNGTAYYYKVTAVNATGESVKSNEASATPAATVMIPAAPTNLTATAGNAQVSLAWTGSTGATSYNVYRSTATGTETSYRTGLTTTSLTDMGLTNGTAYFYKVTAVNTAGESAKSTEASATPTAGGTLQQLLLNPGFESGAASWTATSGVITATTTGEPAHGGSMEAWLDGYGSAHTDSLYQTVTIPSTVTTATLSFWLHIDTAETGTTAYDTLKVQIRNSAGTVLATLATYSNVNAASGYSQKTFSLSAYKGQTIQVYLIGVEDSSLQTSFVVDDFALNAQ